jgi:hypothetical protein
MLDSCFVGGFFLLALRPKFSPFWAKKEVKKWYLFAGMLMAERADEIFGRNEK